MSASIPTLDISARMRWLQARTRVLSDNVANADTPKFRPRDLQPSSAQSMRPGATHAAHMGAMTSAAATTLSGRFETRPSGNAVNLEDEMLKLSETQLEYQMLATLYQKSASRLRTAIGKRG